MLYSPFGGHPVARTWPMKEMIPVIVGKGIRNGALALASFPLSDPSCTGKGACSSPLSRYSRSSSIEENDEGFSTLVKFMDHLSHAWRIGVTVHHKADQVRFRKDAASHAGVALLSLLRACTLTTCSTDAWCVDQADTAIGVRAVVARKALAPITLG